MKACKGFDADTDMIIVEFKRIQQMTDQSNHFSLLEICPYNIVTIRPTIDIGGVR